MTHPDGRLQRLRQAIGHPGEVRQPALVLAELCSRLGTAVDAATTPMVTEQVAEAVPFYAGITLDEIGGRGVRWQERDAASALDAPDIPDAPLEPPPAAARGDEARHGPHALGGPRDAPCAGAQVPRAAPAGRAVRGGRRSAWASGPATRSRYR